MGAVSDLLDSLCRIFWPSGEASTESAPEPSNPADDDAPADSRVDEGGAASDSGAWWRAQPGFVRQTDPPPADSHMAQRLHDIVSTLVNESNSDLPRLSHVTERALMMMRNPDVDYQSLADVVAGDPAQTAHVLRVANSALFGGTSKISSLQQAFARLGFKQIRYIFLTSSLQTLGIQVGGPNRTLAEGIWRHALASGAIAGALARRVGMPVDDAAMLGLLHDLGRFVVLTAAYTYTKEMRYRVPRDVFDPVADHWHELAGLRLAESWGLPEPLPSIISDHHRLPSAGDPLRMPRLLILTTDAISSLLRYAPYHPYDLLAMPCASEFGLVNDNHTRTFLRALPTQVEERVRDLQ